MNIYMYLERHFSKNTIKLIKTIWHFGLIHYEPNITIMKWSWESQKQRLSPLYSLFVYH